MAILAGLGVWLVAGVAEIANAGGPWYVALNGSGGDGLSWANAKTNVQTALDAASDGDTIYLKGETFTLPTNSANGKLVWSGKGLTILGGYAADGGAPGALTSTPTVLLNTGAAYSNFYRVLYISGVTNGTLRRLTIKGGAVGYPTPQWDFRPYYGAGIYMTASSNMVLDTVTLDGNFLGGQQGAETFGGAMYAAADTHGVLTNCTVRNSSIQTHYNTSNYGAGLYLAGGAWSIVDSVVRDNLIFSAGYTATVRGTGVYVAGGTHLIRNCAFSRNTCTGNTPPG